MWISIWVPVLVIQLIPSHPIASGRKSAPSQPVVPTSVTNGQIIDESADWHLNPPYLYHKVMEMMLHQ
jgi:hypothetical protein